MPEPPYNTEEREHMFTHMVVSGISEYVGLACLALTQFSFRLINIDDFLHDVHIVLLA